MKGYLSTSNIDTEEFILHGFGIISDMLLQELKDTYQNDEILLEKIKEKYRYLSPTIYNYQCSQKTSLKDWWHSFICFINTEAFDIYIQSLCEVSRKYDCYVPTIVFALEYAGFQKHTFNSIKVMEKEDAEFFVTEMIKGFEKGYIPKTKQLRIAEALLGSVKEEESEVYAFVKQVEKELASGTFKHLVYHDGDEHLNFNHMYTNFTEVRYTDVLLSKGFQDYVRECDFDNDEYDCMEEIILEYLETKNGENILELIIEEIKNNSNKYEDCFIPAETIKVLKHSEETLTVLELLSLENSDNRLLNYKRKY